LAENRLFKRVNMSTVAQNPQNAEKKEFGYLAHALMQITAGGSAGLYR